MAHEHSRSDLDPSSELEAVQQELFELAASLHASAAGEYGEADVVGWDEIQSRPSGHDFNYHYKIYPTADADGNLIGGLTVREGRTSILVHPDRPAEMHRLVTNGSGNGYEVLEGPVTSAFTLKQTIEELRRGRVIDHAKEVVVDEAERKNPHSSDTQRRVYRRRSIGYLGKRALGQL